MSKNEYEPDDDDVEDSELAVEDSDFDGAVEILKKLVRDCPTCKGKGRVEYQSPCTRVCPTCDDAAQFISKNHL